MKFAMTNLLFLSLIAGCATKSHEPAGQDAGPVVSSSNDTRVQTHLVDETLPHCEHCLLGSAGDEELTKSGKKIYFLYGAEHLNLQNQYFDIPVVFNDATKKWINYFTGRGRDLFKRYAERSGRYAPVLSKILHDQGLPRDLIFLSMAESGFQNHARSWAKAVGAWQFMPYTGKRFGLNIDFFTDERRDPLKATVAASMYLRDLNEMFDSWELAMAAYNAGEGKIKRAIRRYGTKSFWKIRQGRYLKSETKNYVPKIMALAIIGKNLKAFGFEDVEFHRALDFQEITVPGNTDLYNVAEVLGMEFDEVKKYNPELIRWQTPPHEKEYVLRVPVGKKEIWENFENKEAVVAKDYKTYQLKGYASLYHVGRKFKIPTNVLAEINNLDPKKRLFPKTVVYLPFRNDHTKKHSLYADLYEKPRRSIIRRRRYKNFISIGMRRGQKIANPKEFYIVKKGDTLWNISRVTGVNINTLIRSNSQIVKRRQILPGDKLAIR